LPKQRNFPSPKDIKKYLFLGRKYGGNAIEIDFATLREIIKRKYDGNMIEIDSACLPQAGEIDRNSA
jgi:hypothetical protein